jgi:hypothetical protein
MDADNCALACGFVSKSYINQGAQALNARKRQIKALLSSRRLPEQGWDDASIEMLLQVGGGGGKGGPDGGERWQLEKEEGRKRKGQGGRRRARGVR